MFYLPYAYILGMESSIGEIVMNNLLPVSIGNTLGGIILVGIAQWILHQEK
jgi:formate/nitrite transporter FocA (FNT family)